MTSSERRPRGHPIAWSWTDAQHIMFEATSAPDRLLTEDLGPSPDPERFQEWCMKKALRESCERMAQLLNEAGVSWEDVQHLDPNQNRPNKVAEYLAEEYL